MNIKVFKNSLWRIIRKIANLNLAIVILLCIACFSVIGSVLEQEKSLEYYQVNYPIVSGLSKIFNWKIIIFLGLDHIYSTWWFLSILILFSMSIILCTFSTQLPSLKNARRWKFFNLNLNMSSQIKSNIWNSNSLSNMIYALNCRNYYVFHKKFTMYAYKGLVGRIAPIFVHFSIIITLVGFVLTILGSFTIQEMIPNGENIHFKNITKAGIYSRLPNNIICKIDSFFITYNTNNSIKQFFSDITLITNQGKVLINKRIEVNSPLRFQGLTLYQTDWNINALRILINMHQMIQQPVQKIEIGNQVMWLGTLSVDSQTSLIFLILNLQDPILVYDNLGNYIHDLSINKNIEMNSDSFVLKNILVSTGLQIKMDPGIQVVYLGFLIIMISTVMSYVSYCQIWVTINNRLLEINGSVNRGMLYFSKDLSIIQIKYLNFTFKQFLKD